MKPYTPASKVRIPPNITIPASANIHPKPQDNSPSRANSAPLDGIDGGKMAIWTAILTRFSEAGGAETSVEGPAGAAVGVRVVYA
tara:strand:- start:14133 stop:14387 length:255 start_codon:yes stop_codon:yes gene_type:complete